MRWMHWFGAALATAVAMGTWVGCATGGEGGDGGDGATTATGGQSAGGSGGASGGIGGIAGAGGHGGASGGAGGAGGDVGQGGNIGPCGRCRDRINSASLPPCPGTSATLWDAYWGCLCTGVCADECGDNACQGGQDSGACQTCRLEMGLGCGSQYNACLNDN